MNVAAREPFFSPPPAKRRGGELWRRESAS